MRTEEFGCIALLALTLHLPPAAGGEGVRFQHHVDTDEYYLQSNGLLRRIMMLDTELGIHRLLCKDNVILVATSNMSYAETWEPGDLVVGGAEWGCVITDSRESSSADNHREFGFHRVVEQVDIKSDTRVDIYTRPAGLFDLFLEADIYYTHRQPSAQQQSPAGQQHASRRRRRSIVPWRAASQDIPVEYNVHTVETYPDVGSVGYSTMDDESVNTTLSFYEIRQLLNMVNWHEDFHQILPVNYDDESDSALGSYGFIDGKFVYNSSYFEPADDSTARSSNAESTAESWQVHCHECFVYYYPDVVFELQIDQLVGVKKYALRLDGEFESNMNVAAAANDEVSVGINNEVFFKSEENLWISIPLVPDIDMYLTPKFNVTMDAFFDFKTSGPGQLNTGFHEIGNLAIGREWTRDGHTQNYSYTQGETTRPHPRHVDVQGEVYYNMSMMNTLIDLKADIFWKLPKNIFGFYLTSPMQIRVEPNIQGSTWLDEHHVACVDSTASMTASIYVQDIKYNVELLGQKYNFLILPTLEDNTFMMLEPDPIIQGQEVCAVQCWGGQGRGSDMDTSCGPPAGKITRGGHGFDSLVQLLGDNILFALESDSASWCGEEDRACLECTFHVVGHTDDLKCSTRLVTPTLAVKLDRLGQWVKEEWKDEDRRLYVHEAWSEPTSSSPDGGHGDASLYYEGRAARLAVTHPFPNSTSPVDTDPDLLPRLGQLATCSGLDYVRVEGEYVEVGVSVDTPYRPAEYQKLLDFFAVAPPPDAQFCRDYAQYFPALEEGETNPPGKLPEEVVGPIDRRILRNTDAEFYRKLMYYPDNNVQFQDEEMSSVWCGSPTRNCTSCAAAHNTTDLAWNRCSDRVMAPRLAAKLHQLVGLLAQELAEETLTVLEAWDEPTSENPQGSHHEGSLHYEGRAAQLSVSDPSHLPLLSHLAACAGFDMVSRPEGQDYMQVYVKKQSGYWTAYHQFPGSQLLEADLPSFHTREYAYPDQLRDDIKMVPLFDGYGEHGDVLLSEHFKVGEFMAPLRRYLRVDPKLIECLQWTRDLIREPIEILTGYKPRSYNIRVDDRPEAELFRPQAGQAAELRITGYEDPAILGYLAMSVMRACSAQFRVQHHILGVGLHSDRVYIDVRATSIGDGSPWIQLWRVDGDEHTYQQLQHLRTELLTGGAPIVPQSWSISCEIPDLGYDKYWYQVQIRPSCRERGAEFCTSSEHARALHIAQLKQQMLPILGFTDGPKFQSNQQVDDCIATHCGSCNGAGSTWYNKLEACTNMLQSIKQHMYRELRPNTTTFFNTGNSESKVYSLACKGGAVCLENTQIYAVFAPIVMSTYRPDSDKARELRLYDPSMNPSPLIDLIEQDMAHRAQGEVAVYVEYERDLSVLKNVVKILMAVNHNVTLVRFRVVEDLFIDHVYERIQNWIQLWRYDSCPSWSRRTITPFVVETISADTWRFDSRDSQVRNKLQHEERNKDINWLFRM